MNRLTTFKKFTLALIFATIGVISWGQTPEPKDKINLSTCTVTVNEGSPYGYTGSNISVTAAQVVVKTNTDETVSPEYYDITTWPETINAKGQYTLTVTANGTSANYTGSKDRNFYVLAKSGDDYTISDAEDWNRFADCVNDKYSFDGLTVKLTPSSTLSVETMVYNDTYPFSGTFDGNNKTLNVSYSGESYYMAPFYYTEGATIKNLTVTGNIVVAKDDDGYGYSAGLIYSNTSGEYVTRNTVVQNVTVSVNITGIDDNDNEISAGDYCAGFAVYSAYLDFSNCVYNGRIVAGNDCGGFSASYYSNNKNATFSNCIFNPATGSSITGGATFAANSESWPGCYYTDKLGTTAQGVEAFLNEVPAGSIGEDINKNILGYDVYKKVDVAVTGVADVYDFTGSPISITPAVTFDGEDVTADTEYTYSPTTVQNVGNYTLTITGVNNENYHYHGSYTKIFSVTSGLEGSGTEEHPFEIASETDWNYFANKVNTGVAGYASAYYKLTADITVSTMVGTPEHPFSGDFDGRIGDTHAAKTLTFNYGTSESPTMEEIVAPFRYTDGATIHSLIVNGAIHTNAGKESGLIGVNTYTTGRCTTVLYIINYMNLYCYEELWDAQGGGLAYDGSYMHFSYSSHEGVVSASNYHGGFCGKANSSTTFTRCLFDPVARSMYWAENFVYDAQGANINYDGPDPDDDTDGCYYTLGNNQEESNQGTLVYVNEVPQEIVGHKLTNFHEKQIYKPVPVVISGVNKRYIYDKGNELLNISEVGVTFNGENAITNNWCSKVITKIIDGSPVVVESVCDLGKYTLTITAPKAGVESDYLGTVTMLIRVVERTNAGWTGLQTKLSGTDDVITLNEDIVAGAGDVALVVESGRKVTINLNGHTINRNLNGFKPDHGGQVLKVNAEATVVINGPGTITGGRNWASSNTEFAENSDGGGIYNMGHLTLNGYHDAENGYDTIYIINNKCVKLDSVNPGTYRTARGGGIYSGKGSTLIVNGCVIRENNAQGGGGGIFADKADTLTVDHNTVIRSNKSLDKGGGVRVNSCTTANMTGCTIISNTVELHNHQSASNGGGIHLDGGTLNMTNCTINQNYSSKYGGGIYMMGGTLNANNCNISFNRSYDAEDLFEGYGGGVCVLNGTFKMNGGTITGNSSYITNGGGVFVAANKTFKIEGAVNISGNWTYNNSSLTEQHITNVYLVGTNDKITINGNIEGASVGVSKNGETGRFTNNLNGRGTIANFVSDDARYQILPDGTEAKIGTPATWNDPTPDPETKEITITEPTYINTTVTESYEYTIVFSGDGCLIIGPNGVLTAKIENNDPLKLIIEDGGQVITNNTVAARVKKEVKEFEKVSYNYWYLIASPINNPAIATATNIVVLDPEMVLPTPGYDLYRFNESTEITNPETGLLLQWENYRADHADFTTLANGRGYLYRSCQDYTLTIDGNLIVGTVGSYTLTNIGGNVMKGFNVIGNPYPHNIKKGADEAIPNTYLEGKYYVLNPEGCQWVLTDDGSIIPPLTGILVQANNSVGENGQTLTISDIVPLSSKGVNEVKNNNIWFTVANNTYEDRACVEFKEGHGLNKIAHQNENAPMLYIRHNDEDFASVDMGKDTKSIDLYFKTAKMSQYTLSVKPQGEFEYLHLYDKVTGEDMDLLEEHEYTFIGSTADDADRFVVRLSPSTPSTGSGTKVFVWQSGNDIIVEGNGELQVFDVMGRLVSTQYVNGVETVEKPSQTGVYVFRLEGKAQKIVLR